MTTKAYYAPVRPPRGSKVSKDTSGRLITIIAELSISKNNQDRNRKMEDLKNDMVTTDDRLLKLLQRNRQKLSVIMESYSNISAVIENSRTRCSDVKSKLIACKKLLECKREEIKRLYAESIEHKCVLSMLKEICDLNHLEGKVEECLTKRQFLKATEYLVGGASLLEGKLSEADGLKDLKDAFSALKKKLHLIFVDEIIKCLYESNVSRGEKMGYDELLRQLTKDPIKLPVEGSYDFSKQNKYNEICVFLQCISLLGTLTETVEILKQNCSKELMVIIRNLSEMMYHAIENSPYPCKKKFSYVEQPHYLRDLLKIVLLSFRQVSINHFAFLDCAMKNSNNFAVLYDENMLIYIYSKIQTAIEVFLTDYLDLHNTSSATEQVTTHTFTKLPTNISSFFLRKGNITRTKRKSNSLFNFDSSSHAINKKNYLQDYERDNDVSLFIKEKGEMDSCEMDKFCLISQPNLKNIQILYKTLRNFICEMENSLQLEAGTHCPLHTFLADCVKIFLDQVITMDVNRLIERTLESWKPVHIDEMKFADGAKSPQILSSTMSIKSRLTEMEQLIYDLPDYATHFLQMICSLLESYKDILFSAYKSLIFVDSGEDQKVFSVSWGRDPDIGRLLRSLPNWIVVKGDSLSQVHDFEESPEEVRFRNKSELDLLIRNLCNREISPAEIISDHSKLTNLALMHESCEYFSSQIISFADRLSLKDFSDSEASVSALYFEKFSDENTDGANFESYLRKLAMDFEDLASTCLLVLHLEVRAHCFYYPLINGAYSNRKDDEEPEPEVLKLNADLLKCDEALSPVLQSKKLKYIFEGLGDLLSTIMINSVSNIKKVNENGVKKMGRNIFAIQQNLAGITMTREVALDRARQYFELLNHSYEDILNQIVEEGPQFQEHEYSALIQLLHNSREGVYEQPLNYYLEKLRQILDEVAVSV